MKVTNQAKEAVLSGTGEPAVCVLVVDDDGVKRRDISVLLTRLGYTVSEAETVDHALRLCLEKPFEIVISRRWIGGECGLKFCRAFRKIPRDSYGYFIFMTPVLMLGDVKNGYISGADDFLEQPVSEAELQARLVAGSRISRMHWELTCKNFAIEETLHELQQLYDSIDLDLIEAKRLLHSHVKEREVQLGPTRISQVLRTAGRVGGDLVGFHPAGSDRVTIYSLDVSGHGVASALATARLAGLISSIVPQQDADKVNDAIDGLDAIRPDLIAAQLNDIALREMEGTHYFTMALADVDMRDGKVRLTQAGHPYPLIQRADGRLDQLGDGGFPIGLIEEATFDVVEDQLFPGDRLILASDGVTECRDRLGDLLGEGGFHKMLDQLVQVRGIAFLEALVWNLSDRTEGGQFDDDISAISLELMELT